jgi:hypothetical protein
MIGKLLVLAALSAASAYVGRPLEAKAVEISNCVWCISGTTCDRDAIKENCGSLCGSPNGLCGANAQCGEGSYMFVCAEPE